MNPFPKALSALCLVWILLLMPRIGQSQEPIPDLGSLGIDAARAYVNSLSEQEISQVDARKTLVASGLHSGNLELIKLIAENPVLGRCFWEEFGRLEDSATKEKILPMLLRIESPGFWTGVEVPLKRGPTFFPKADNADPFPYEKMVIKRLTNRPVSWERFLTVEARRQLADELEAGVSRDGALQFPHPQPVFLPRAKWGIPPGCIPLVSKILTTPSPQHNTSYGHWPSSPASEPSLSSSNARRCDHFPLKSPRSKNSVNSWPL